MSEIAKQIDRIINNGLAKCLKSEEYVKKTRTFYLRKPAVIKIVNVQASMGNMGDQGKFTLNLGLYSPEIAKLLEGKVGAEFPKEYDCSLRQRIGSLMPAKTDHWWTLPGDETALAQEIVYAWQEYGKPWIDGFDDTESIIQGLISGKYLFIASKVYLKMGDLEKAKRFFSEWAASSGKSNPHGLDWGRKAGLL
jgi:hypothetical protein